MVLVLPVLTRLYSPADFTVLAVYASVLGIFAGIACLRLEIAIPIPETDDEAANLLALALASAAGFGTISGLLVWLFPVELAALSGQPQFEPYLWLLPFGIWLSGSYAALQFWATRKKQFALIAKTRLSQATGSTGVQVGFGWAGIAPFGLLLGQLINSGAGVIGLGLKTWRDHRGAITAIRPMRMLATLRQYDRFPKYSVLEAFANNGGIQFPVLIIAALAAGPEAGFLMLATRVMAAPMGLIGGAVSQVYLSRAPEEKRQGRLGPFTATVIGGLFKMGVGPLLFAGIVAPVAFPLVFGAEWARAGQIVSWMTPWFAVQFLASPVSMTLHVTDNQKAAFSLQITGLLLRVGAVLAAAQFATQAIVEIYALSGFVFYAFYLIVVVRLARISVAELNAALRTGWWSIGAWLLIAANVHLLLSYGQEHWF
nr:oligosaccharide flippase family protein [Aromatoleum aromaticum]